MTEKTDTEPDIRETVKSILGIIRSLKNIANVSGNELSEKALLLSIHKVYLGQKLVSFEFDLDNDKMIRKVAWGEAFSEAEGTVDAKKISADSAVNDMLREEIDLERKVGVLKNLRYDVSEVISTVQSRMSQLRIELTENK